MNDGPGKTAALQRAEKVYLPVRTLIERFAAVLGLVLAAPLLGYLAWRIRRDSPGPALFKQTRAGRNAAPFQLYKFRTMRTDVDPYGDSPHAGDDPRITRLGRWLRESSLDELPQLINVARGEMSLIGPRPLYLQQIAEWNERERLRLQVKPGLTGLAQISGRGALTIEQKLELDVQYVESIGLFRDLRILWQTMRGLLRRDGIYEVKYSHARERRSDEKSADPKS